MHNLRTQQSPMEAHSRKQLAGILQEHEGHDGAG